jgi:small subunit ribosomal protein S14
MAKKALVEKHKKKKVYSVREYNRCDLCGNSRGYMRKFRICRKCFRELSHKGEIPGVRKSSW